VPPQKHGKSRRSSCPLVHRRASPGRQKAVAPAIPERLFALELPAARAPRAQKRESTAPIRPARANEYECLREKALLSAFVARILLENPARQRNCCCCTGSWRNSGNLLFQIPTSANGKNLVRCQRRRCRLWTRPKEVIGHLINSRCKSSVVVRNLALFVGEYA